MTASTSAEASDDADRERFFAIRRTDSEPIFGEYGWMNADHADDWHIAEEDSAHDDVPIEYEIVEMIVVPVATRTFGEQVAEEIDS